MNNERRREIEKSYLINFLEKIHIFQYTARGIVLYIYVYHYSICIYVRVYEATPQT